MVELTPVIADQLAGCSKHLPLDVYGPGVGGDQGGEHYGGEHHQEVRRREHLDLRETLQLPRL